MRRNGPTNEEERRNGPTCMPLVGGLRRVECGQGGCEDELRGTVVVAGRNGPTCTPLVGGLRRLECGRGGHTLARHVGRTDAQLAARLSRQRRIPAASTFTSRRRNGPTCTPLVGGLRRLECGRGGCEDELRGTVVVAVLHSSARSGARSGSERSRATADAPMRRRSSSSGARPPEGRSGLSQVGRSRDSRRRAAAFLAAGRVA